ncbi:MAG: alpha/beta fold hydrolase [Pseudomonadota bacterium]|nr:alpha/beta fold hydrolase [Gammaproteobacteria bacterium]MBU1559109.1 alpha/beta fold hydrolase [Gammaproteobacteria bacterium]MBU1927048.1 alpha/beta fold hydrolase [Gammaproteobacteria bacterium]MBU2545861.1 alpha/beta fold hydrolase [Gammaproteobacteria bacterium]
MTQRIVDHHDIHLWTESFGNSEDKAVLLIAGAHAPSTFWPDFFCNDLASHHHFVIRYDHRDIGCSSHLPTTEDINQPLYTLKDLAEDALAILDAYGIRKASVVGHSMGGAIVQYLAAFHSDRLLNAVSISANISYQLKHPDYERTMEKLLENKPTGDFENDWPGWLQSWKLLHGDDWAFDETMAKSYTKAIYTRHEGGDLKPAWNHIAAGLTKPALIERLPNTFLLIHGSKDILQPVDEIESLKNRFNVHIIAGAGHVFFNKKIWVEIRDIILSN